MIKRPTLAVVALFAIALVILLIVQNRSGQSGNATPTPAATAMANLITDWQASDVTEAVLSQAIGGTITLTRNPDGSWNNAAAGTVAPGKVEQLLSELLATKILIELPTNYSLDDLQLTVPAQTVTLRAADGRQTVIQVGGLTPTQSGYYVKVDDNAPVAVSKYAIEAVTTLFNESLPSVENSPTP